LKTGDIPALVFRGKSPAPNGEEAKPGMFFILVDMTAGPNRMPGLGLSAPSVRNKTMTGLVEREKILQDFMDTVRDEYGLLYSGVRADELRPWRNDEMEQWCPMAEFYRAINPSDPATAWAYEDGLMTTGEYINAKILKHLWSGGDSRALADAERSIRGVLTVSREGDKVEDGFLPKPHFGPANASKSRQMSNDQVEHPLFGMWSFRKVCPGSPLIPEIDSAIVRWTDFFVRKDFSYKFHPDQWVCTDPADMGDGLPVYMGRHTLGLYFPMCIMCRELTGETKYDDLIHNRLLPSLRRFIEDPLRSYSGSSNSSNLMGMGMYFCCRKGVIVEEAKRALEMCCEISERSLSRHDGLEYEYGYAGASDDNPFEPRYLDRQTPPVSAGGKFAIWVSNVKSACSTKTAHTDALLQRIDPKPERAATIRLILEHFKKPQDFTHWIDPDGTQVPSDMPGGYTLQLCPQYIAAWLQAYYFTNMPPDMDEL